MNPKSLQRWVQGRTIYSAQSGESRGAQVRNIWLAVAAISGVSLAWGVFAAAFAAPSMRSDDVVAALGHRLFLDPRLSPNNSTNCASCHEPTHAFSDGRPTSIGFDHRKGTRNTPSLLNVFPDEPLFWDGRRQRLDVAVLDPLVNRVEMGNRDLAGVVDRLKADPTYRKAFEAAFHEGARSISTANLGTTLAAFIGSLPRLPNAYDRFKAGQTDALSPPARVGLRIFNGKAGCARCHDPVSGRFTDDKFHHSGVGLGLAQDHLGALTMQAMRKDPHDTAMGSAIGSNAQLAALGRFLATHRASDVGAFRTPSLRNVALTAPYMHDGSIKTLVAAVDAEIYYRGLATGKPIALTASERADLVAFLRSLTSSPQVTNGTKHVRPALKP